MLSILGITYRHVRFVSVTRRKLHRHTHTHRQRHTKGTSSSSGNPLDCLSTCTYTFMCPCICIYINREIIIPVQPKQRKISTRSRTAEHQPLRQKRRQRQGSPRLAKASTTLHKSADTRSYKSSNSNDPYSTSLLTQAAC